MRKEKAAYENDRTRIKEEGKQRIPTIEHAAKLFFLSFRFSQGHVGLQNQILRYLHEMYPNWRITTEHRDAIDRIVRPQINKFLGLSAEQPAKPRANFHADLREDADYVEIASENIRLELDKLEEIMNGQDTTACSLAELADGIIAKDYTYLTDRKAGRPRQFTKGSQAASAVADPWVSHIMYYGYENHDTGTPEYNQMFRDIITL